LQAEFRTPLSEAWRGLPVRQRSCAQLCWTLLVVLCLTAPRINGASSKGSPDSRVDRSTSHEAQVKPQHLVAEVMNNELDADLNDHSLWMYISEKVDHDKRVTKRVVETPQGDLDLLIAVNGHPLPPEELKKEQEGLDAVARDPHELAKRQQDEHEDEKKARELMKMLPAAFLYKYEGERNGIIHLSFRPNPQFNPPTREEKVFHSMAGVMWIQAREKRLVKLAGHLLKDVDFGLGVLGKLQKGGTFEIDRAEFAPTHWKTTLTDVHISGRALFFKSISEQQHEVDRGYKQVPSLSPIQAAKLLDGHVTLAQIRGGKQE
jgi:hypothetical protein